MPYHSSSPTDRVASLWQRGVRLATRLAIAFGLSTLAAIMLGAAATDNAFVQIIVTVLAALALWMPFAVLIVRVERFFASRRSRRERKAAPAKAAADDSWRRLFAVAPGQGERLTAMQRSLERSRLALGGADLDPDAHDLCVLIDRRLPELIHRELDSLPPDDVNRRRQVAELIDLIEQFARHCGRRRDEDSRGVRYDAEVLRRRFEERLSFDPKLASRE